MSITAVVTVEDFTAFRERVVVLRNKLERLGRGAQQRASYELSLGPSRISTMLNCRYYDIGALERLEEWVAEQEVCQSS